MKEKLSVLVIDDEDNVRNTLCENLQGCGFDVFQANDGETGVQFIRKNGRPHVVLTDIIMPKKEGIETIREIKRKYPDIKLIAMSGGGRAKAMDFLTLAEKLGADAILPKPIDIEKLETTIHSLAEA